MSKIYGEEEANAIFHGDNPQYIGKKANPEAVEATKDAFAMAETLLGKVDILVNNAGASKAGPFLNITDKEWHDDFELKLFAAIRLCRLALPAMQSRKWGRIINVLNIGSKAPGANGAPTAVARAA